MYLLFLEMTKSMARYILILRNHSKYTMTHVTLGPQRSDDSQKQSKFGISVLNIQVF